MSAIQVSPQQVTAFRLRAHHLAQRLPNADWQQALSACPLQNTPPGAAEISLLARVADYAPGTLERALSVEKTLLQTWSLRGAPHIFTSADASVYTQGLLPQGAQETTAFILGIQGAMDRSGMTVDQVVEHTIQAVRHVLDQRVITGKQTLDQSLAAWIAPRLSAAEAAAWAQPSIYAQDQTMGEAMVSFALRIAALRGWICFAPRQGQQAAFTRADQWLDLPPPGGLTDYAVASAAISQQLAHQYLRCYGPSSPQDFAAWAGIANQQSRRIWQTIADDLAEVRLDGKALWLLRDDLQRLESAVAMGEGARLLPAHDPFLQMRDRQVLIADPRLRREVWRITGAPGLVLAAGRPVATWRSRMQAKGKTSRLLLSITPFAALTPQAQEWIEAEAQRLAALKACAAAQVAYNN